MSKIDLNELYGQVKAMLDSGNVPGALEVLEASGWSPDLPHGPLCQMQATAHFRLGHIAEAQTGFGALAENSLGQAMLAGRNLAALLNQQGEYQACLEALSDCRQLYPYDKKGFSIEVAAQGGEGRYDLALDNAKHWLEVFPGDPEALNMALSAAIAQAKWIEALVLAGEVERRHGMNEELVGLMASVFLELHLMPAAQELLGDILSGHPSGYAIAHAATANYLYFSRRYREAGGHYERALALQDIGDEARLNHALVLLASGQFREGWGPFVFRKNSMTFMHLDGVPEWRGESLEGKKVLVDWEQGLGDSIQFMRYLPLLAKITPDLVFNAQPEILPLLLEGQATMTIEAVRETLDKADLQLHLGDLPQVCKTAGPEDIPAEIPYLFADPGKASFWQQKLAEFGGLKVGLVWAGNPEHLNDHHRSARLSDFASLASLPGVSWFSLQLGGARQELNFVPGDWPIHDLAPEISDYGDTAAILANLDLLISVDTSVAHLAGALGRPVWLLLPKFRVDWRWEIAEETSPWYPSFRLFRQVHDADWVNLISGQVRKALWMHLDGLPNLPEVLQQLIGGWVEREEMLAGWSDAVTEADLGWVVSLLLEWSARGNGADQIAGVFAKFHGSSGHRGMLPVLALRAGIDGAEDVLQRLSSAGGLGTSARVMWAAWLRDHLRETEGIAVLGDGLRTTTADPRLVAGVGWCYAKLSGGASKSFEWFERAIRLYPKLGNVVLDYAIGLMNQNRGDEALDQYGRALRLMPGDRRTWTMLSLHLRRRGLPNLSARIQRALLQEERSPEGLCDLAESLALQGKDAEAEAILNELDSVALNAAQRGAYAMALRALGLTADFEKHLEMANDDDQKVPEVGYQLGWRYLKTGRFTRGWEMFSRYLPVYRSDTPEWQGEPLVAKRIVVYQDHGFGDLIQFLPLLNDLAALGAEVTLAVHKVAYSLVAFQKLPVRVIQIVDLEWMVASFDYQVSQLRLPALLGTDLLSHQHQVPFLRAPDKRLTLWRQRILADQEFKVGIIWAGNPRYINDHFRTSELADWSAFCEIPGLSLYSFQKDAASEQAAGAHDLGLKNIAADCKDWLDTAAMMSMMDLIISVDTGGAHVAAGLGKETWVLIPPIVTDFRWQDTGESCPWYPTLRLFRQARLETWRAVLDRVAIVLSNRLVGQK